MIILNNVGQCISLRSDAATSQPASQLLILKPDLTEGSLAHQSVYWYGKVRMWIYFADRTNQDIIYSVHYCPIAQVSTTQENFAKML